MLSTRAEGAKDVLRDSCALMGYLAYLGHGAIRAHSRPGMRAGQSGRWKVCGMYTLCR